jgi:hypothetical protein
MLAAHDGFLVAQADGLPAAGRKPTSTWSDGEVIIDPHSLPLPADMALDELRMVVGLYELASGQRLALAGSRDDAGDQVALSWPARAGSASEE